MWVAILGMVSACGFTDEQREYTLVGAATGAAIGGGIGGGVFAADNSDNWVAIPAGVVGGALIGGLIGAAVASATTVNPGWLSSRSRKPRRITV